MVRILAKYGIGLFALCCLFLASSAGAVGVAVNPAEVTMTAVAGGLSTVRLKVANPSADVAVFEVYPDDFAPMIKATPSSFTLEAGAEKYVTIEVAARETGRFSTNLSVVARPLASNAFQAGSGVKVPLTVTAQEVGGLASAFAALGTSPWTGVAGLLVLGGWVVYRRRGKMVILK